MLKEECKNGSKSFGNRDVKVYPLLFTAVISSLQFTLWMKTGAMRFSTGALSSVRTTSPFRRKSSVFSSSLP